MQERTQDRCDQGQLEGCLLGDLETWPLLDIITWIFQTGRTCMLRVGPGLRAGVLFFQDGQLYRCEWGELLGEQALLQLLDLSQGEFTLIQRQPPDARPNIAGKTGELLLQLTMWMDERRRMGAA